MLNSKHLILLLTEFIVLSLGLSLFGDDGS